MASKLSHAIEFVGDMERAVTFYRDVLNGGYDVRLAPGLHENPAGKVEIGFEVPDLQTFHDQMTAKGVRFPIAPKKQEYGGVLARFEDSEGASVTVNGKQGDR